MNKIDFKEYWSDKTSSLNRSSEVIYYQKKAYEHLNIMRESNLQSGVVDFGCGACELLTEISRITDHQYTAIDFSKSLLGEASKAVNADRVTLVHSSARSYAMSAKEEVWMSCGAVNQYSDRRELEDFIQVFWDNDHSRALYFFDCIDPVKYRFFSSRIIGSFSPYKKSNGLRPFLVKIGQRLMACLYVISGRYARQVESLGAMGYGVRPEFWYDVTKGLKVQIEIVSSAVFEYRYHVRLEKQ